MSTELVKIAVFSTSFFQLLTQRNQEWIALEEFLLKFTSNDGFQIFLDVILNFAAEKDCLDWIVIKHWSGASVCISFLNNFNFL